MHIEKLNYIYLLALEKLIQECECGELRGTISDCGNEVIISFSVRLGAEKYDEKFANTAD